MFVQTGTAILKKNENGDNYWHTWDDSSKDGYDMNVGESIEFNPDSFEDDTEIKIFEKVD